MAFQQQIARKQALGNLGQISKSPQGFCDVKPFIAKDNSVKIGEFVKLITGTNEVVTAQDGTLTGEVLGVCVNDSLQVSNNSTNADISKRAGSSVQILTEGNIFIRTDLTALVGQFVLIDQNDGSLFFSDTAEATGFIYTGWRVSMENNPANPGIIEITTAGASKSAGGGGGGGGVVIDDNAVSPTKAWSSNKINTELNSKVSIADDEIVTTKGWSSSKINTELNTKATIDDNATATTSTWSSDKISTDLATKATINDTQIATTSTWSSDKINTELATKASSADLANKAEIDDTQELADKTWSSQKIQNELNGVATIDDNVVETNSTWSSRKIANEFANTATIDDDVTEEVSVWSSQKVSDELDTKAEINDIDMPSATSTWSSQKIYNELDTKAEINDAATELTSTWSSQKVSDELDTKAEIDDTQALADKTWSSEKISQIIDDTKGEGDTENTWSADKLSKIIDDNEISVNSTWSSDKISKLSVSSNYGLPGKIEKTTNYLYNLGYSALDYTGALAIEGGYETALNGGCTTIYKNGIFGRNFDWKYSHEIEAIVKLYKSATNYASISFCGGVAGLTADKMATKTYEPNDLKILPFFVRDGFNEHGVAFSINIVPSLNNTNIIPAISTKHTISAVCLGRFVLDNFKTAKEAVMFIRNYVKVVFSDTLTALGFEAHYLIADPAESYCLEFINNSAVIEQFNSVTNSTGKKAILANFHRNGVVFNADESVYTPFNDGGAGKKPHADNNIELNGQGLERHNIALNAYDNVTNKVTMLSEMLDNLLFTQGAYVPISASNSVFYTDFVGTNSLNVDSALNSFIVTQTNAHNEFISEATDETRRNEGKLWHSIHSVVYDLNNLDFIYYYDENLNAKTSEKSEFSAKIIDDASITSDKTWSSNKINAELSLKAQINDLEVKETEVWSSKKTAETISGVVVLDYEETTETLNIIKN